MNELTARFAYAQNRANTDRRDASLSRYWPPGNEYRVHSFDLSPWAANLPPRFVAHLGQLGALIDAEWLASKRATDPALPLGQAEAIANLLEAMATELPDHDREALLARADYVRSGDQQRYVSRLMSGREDISVFAGKLSTWFGKERLLRPSAFVWRRDHALHASLQALIENRAAIDEYLAGLDKRLLLSEPPLFMGGNLVQIAGEANLNPKHIGYFMPEDEGVKHAREKMTYYFSNAHQSRMQHIALPLYRDLLDSDGGDKAVGHEVLITVAAAGVLAHEFGHNIQRPVTSYADLNATDRWVSVVLQETVADVLGTLLLAEVWAGPLGITPEQAVAYYLADCLGYASRGLGLFPDSDGMVLQLNYLAEFGALYTVDDASRRMRYTPESVLAALRSLARVLADSLLAGDTDAARALHRDFGPQSPSRIPSLMNALETHPPQAVEYVQQHFAQLSN